MIRPYNENSQPSDEIANRIRANRYRVSKTLDAISQQLSPAKMMERTVEEITEHTMDALTHGSKNAADKVVQKVSKKPLPLILMATGLALFIWGTKENKRSDRSAPSS